MAKAFAADQPLLPVRWLGLLQEPSIDGESFRG